MSTYDPSNPEPEGDGKPSFDKKPPQPGSQANGTPASGSPYDAVPPPSAEPFGGGAPYGVRPGGPYDSADPSSPYRAPGYGGPAAPVPGMPPLGSWLSRIVARLIDYVIIQIVAFLLVLPFTGFGSRDGWTGGVWLFYGLYLIYEGTMLSRDGQTLGKKVMNVRVAMLIDGSSPNGSAGWTRAATYTLPAVLCCGLWWLADGMFGVFDKPYRQCVHDKAAKTVVVSTV
ncbi:putative RDD family membrane protein YckC [Kitasatospora sp. MAA4]|uniref:RDD family protein n=1 Tax=Kitasatospora sp. MAA4 TaxID=3035093 RepID=UPI002474D65A|nr:RDD family protein [Kitasatospora sp. MAA4]MDH6135246.1 putative RDD family membrane protein YckC [Kitasatospora sp. MAA4]